MGKAVTGGKASVDRQSTVVAEHVGGCFDFRAGEDVDKLLTLILRTVVVCK